MLIGFNTQDANFYLKEPPLNYKPFMLEMWKQSFIVKFIIKFLENCENNGINEDFWTTCLVCPIPQISEFTFKSVIKHTEFLVNKFLSYQQAIDAETHGFFSG